MGFLALFDCRRTRQEFHGGITNPTISFHLFHSQHEVGERLHIGKTCSVIVVSNLATQLLSITAPTWSRRGGSGGHYTLKPPSQSAIGWNCALLDHEMGFQRDREWQTCKPWPKLSHQSGNPHNEAKRSTTMWWEAVQVLQLASTDHGLEDTLEFSYAASIFSSTKSDWHVHNERPTQLHIPFFFLR